MHYSSSLCNRTYVMSSCWTMLWVVELCYEFVGYEFVESEIWWIYMKCNSWLSWHQFEGEPSSFLFLVVSVVSLWGGARSLLILIMVIELHNKYFRLLLWVCIWVVINYQKGGDWKCNHALNHILMLMTTHMLGTNHVYQVYLRIMFQRPCAWIMTRDKKHITQEWRYKMLTSFMVCSWV